MLSAWPDLGGDLESVLALRVPSCRTHFLRSHWLCIPMLHSLYVTSASVGSMEGCATSEAAGDGHSPSVDPPGPVLCRVFLGKAWAWPGGKQEQQRHQSLYLDCVLLSPAIYKTLHLRLGFYVFLFFFSFSAICAYSCLANPLRKLLPGL